MPHINIDLLRQRIQDVRESEAVLKEYALMEEGEFLRNRQVSDAVKYRLLVMIEACIAICTHLVSRLANKAPETFAECFESLREKSVISDSLCRKLQEMSRFRNLIIHGYWKVDDAKVYQIMQNDLSDFDSYLRSIDTFLKETGQ